MAHFFRIKKDGKGEYRAYFEHSNGNKIFWTEGYSSKSGAENAIDSIKKNGPGAEVVDES